MPTRTVSRDTVRDLERELARVEADLARLNQEREATKQALQRARQSMLACPRCGRDHDFLTDGGGFLVHVLEDPEDRDLLQPGKPLFCPNCGEVFLCPEPAVLNRGRKAPKAPI